jgi:hypothetical protein
VLLGVGLHPESRIDSHKSVSMQIARTLLTTVFSLLAACAALHAQAPQLEPNPAKSPVAPTVTFTFDWAGVEPHRYVISVDSGGNAVYRSWTADPGSEQSSAVDPYGLKFAVSGAARDRIFALALQLNYFNGDFEYRKHRVASTGDKTLAYADPDKQYATRYNWSENAGISELTAFFQGMSATIEAGRRLERLYRFERLGLDEELKNLERLASERQATELQLIAPILEQLAQDPAVLNIARQRARHILQMAAVPPASNSQASHQ